MNYKRSLGERKDYLEVKVRSRKVNEERRRLLTRGILLISGVVISLLLTIKGAQYVAGQLFFENQQYRLKKISVVTNGRLTKEEVLRYSGIKSGDNLFALEMQEVRKRLEGAPYIKKVEIRRELPDKLLLTVQERMPLARFVVAETSTRPMLAGEYHIDQEGVILEPRSNDASPLPQLIGARLEEVQVGKAVENAEVLAAMKILAQTSTSSMRSMVEISSVDVSRVNQVTLITRDGARIKFLTEYLNIQIERLEVIVKFCQENSKEIQTADLTVEQNVPVVFKQ
ncbi:MAG: FtsQ-type POTRA domain-containing protein [Verrucomicrobiota bacterium]|nr:FtsQ-type POTRA domain-containing protein [Verrucomicrobiota bacterium]